MGDRIPALRAVGEAGPVGAHPPSAGRGGIAWTDDQRVLTDAVGPLLGISVNRSNEATFLPGVAQAIYHFNLLDLRNTSSTSRRYPRISTTPKLKRRSSERGRVF